MALGTDHVTLTEASAASRTRSNSSFIRELWTDEIIAVYKSALVMPQLVVVKDHKGSKGDTIHIPTPVRGVASQKAAETQVTLIANQETQKQYLIDQHWEYSRVIEDIVTTQADDSLRMFYTDDAGYALAKRVDTELHQEGAKFAGGDGSPLVEGTAYSKAFVGTPVSSALVPWDPTANTNAGNASTITDEGVRLGIQALDDSDVPSIGRVLVLPPVEVRRMLGIDRQIVFDQVGEAGRENAIRNGFVGPLYGVEVFKSTNTETVAATDASTDQFAALLFQKEAILFIEQAGIRAQTQYKQEYLSDLFTTDTIFGSGVLRPEAGLVYVVPATG